MRHDINSLAYIYRSQDFLPGGETGRYGLRGFLLEEGRGYSVKLHKDTFYYVCTSVLTSKLM